jgi:hypothetical protein
MDETITEHIREALRIDHVSFAELSRIDGFKGNLALVLDKNPNIILWTGMSEAAVASLNALLKEDYCHIHPTTTLVYMIDAQMPQMPLAKSNRKYKDPHWAPVTLKLGARCNETNCPRRAIAVKQ